MPASSKPDWGPTWASVGIVAAATGLAVLMQAVAGLFIAFAMGFSSALPGRPRATEVPEQVVAFFTSGIGILLMVALSETAYLLVAWLIRPPPGQSHLQHWGLINPGLPIWNYPVLFCGTLFCACVGVLLVGLLGWLWPVILNQDAPSIWGETSLTLLVAWVLLVAIAPGFAEEVLFRGLLLRRLLAARSATWAISVTSILFALAHISPNVMLFALPLGAFFGVIAWRTGSVIPTILCHAGLNGAWNAFFIVATYRGWSDDSVSMNFLGVFIASAPGMLLSCLLLRNARPAPSGVSAATFGQV